MIYIDSNLTSSFFEKFIILQYVDHSAFFFTFNLKWCTGSEESYLQAVLITIMLTINYFQWGWGLWIVKSRASWLATSELNEHSCRQYRRLNFERDYVPVSTIAIHTVTIYLSYPKTFLKVMTTPTWKQFFWNAGGLTYEKFSEIKQYI